MSFTSNYRVTVQKPAKADADMGVLFANSDYLAPKVGFSGVRVIKNSQSIVGGSAVRTVSWTSASYDTNAFGAGSWFSAGTPTYISIPTGVTKAQVDLSFTSDLSTRDLSDGAIWISSQTGAGTDFDGMPYLLVDGLHAGSIATAIIDVSALGIIAFQAQLMFNSGAAANVSFAMSARGWPS